MSFIYKNFPFDFYPSDLVNTKTNIPIRVASQCSPISFFCPRIYPKGYYFYSLQSSSVMKSKWWLQQYKHEQGFAHPKYACPAGYSTLHVSVYIHHYIHLPFGGQLYLTLSRKPNLSLHMYECGTVLCKGAVTWLSGVNIVYGEC